MEILRAGARRASPWKNGGGITAEIAVHPLGASMDDFGWRLSMAEVAAPGPFSRFPGIDRILTVLAGRLALDFEDATSILDAASGPLAFPGDVPVHGRPLGGPVRDLNVMVRRGHFTAGVEALDGAREILAGEGTVFVVALVPLDVGTPGGGERLDMSDALRLEPGESVTLSGGAGLALRLRPA
ncbi:HutD family protein [Aurantimonas sp. Leaf443]|uniref:HutD/Ves family protein n=1 Tax=Aurantimonas sp. Leaf443 TaxID=1736378 RepID=UPI0006FF8427|nr:HutD family protein [Aurantimonas sp. Leaf443]KQT85485.1 hypothetical protein ASG48_09695 [Aurantimonas sp. Leaf443]